MVDLSSIELFWRAANYLTVGMLYLRANPLLKEELQRSHFKDKILGHWGACPSINAIYAHVSDLIRRKGRFIHMIIGTGHAGTALLPCMYLDGSLKKYYPEFSMDEKGIIRLFNAYAKRSEFPTEMSKGYPGMVYIGGELGYALAFSHGFAMGNPNNIIVCVVGDGEIETSTTQASWQGFSFLSRTNDGKVLPVINANGYKMGSSSLFSLKSRGDIIKFFQSHGLDPIFVGRDHSEIAKAFDDAYSELMSVGGHNQPIIILETPKGWTAPRNFGDRRFEGHFNSHKPILKNPNKNDYELQMIADWLRSYCPNELFDQNGKPFEHVTRCLPHANMRLGHGHAMKRIKYHFNADISKFSSNSKANSIVQYLVCALETNNIFIFSPDELSSNKMGALLDKYRLKIGDVSNEFYNKYSNIYEILNEHLCFAWAQGCSRSGNYPIIISYEAFAPIFFSMAEQFVKSLIASEYVNWQPKCPSLNIILTSLGWYNTPTHHNPGFVDNFIGRNIKQVHIYMPVFVGSALRYFDEMLSSNDRLNILVFDKYSHMLEKYKNLFLYHQSWIESKNESSKINVILIAIGDCMLEQTLKADELLKTEFSEYKTKIIAIEDLSLLECNVHPEWRSFKETIGNIPAVWIYNGFPKTIRSILWKFGIISDTVVLGYNDYDQTCSGKDRFDYNGVGICDIVKAVKYLIEGETW